jgi:hypothetical protein
MVTLFATVIGVIVALQQVAKSGFGAFPAAALIVSAVSFCLLLYFERRAQAPLLDRSLFLRWLNFNGLPGAVVPPYTEWGKDPEIYIRAFQSSWTVIAVLTSLAIVTSAMRGADERGKGKELE